MAIEGFLSDLVVGLPTLAVVDSTSVTAAPPRLYDSFAIVASDDGSEGTPQIAPDIATCAACFAELNDSTNRRFQYPFISCTHCGPRFTIVEDLPWDRARTTMAPFAMCADCRQEYADPGDRRFHAETIACPACGPVLRLHEWSSTGDDRYAAAALQGAVASLRAGQVVAVKGLGGYHLACDAASSDAVRRLRLRKQRDAKPFAIMVADVATASRWADIDAVAAEALSSAERPILLLEKRSATGIAPEVAPGSRWLGIMLPYTPLHHLLLEGVGRPLVMTSGNRSNEPMAFRDDDARCRLGGIADAVLSHNRAIATRCDDSVRRVDAGVLTLWRRSRGIAPRPLTLPEDVRVPTLGVGGHLKNAFCLGTAHSAVLSHHVGDLDSPDAYAALRETIAQYSRCWGVIPAVIAHDRHPDYASTRLAEELELPAARVAVQHHHAHVASCMWDNGVTEPVLGVAFDGAGLGDDGAIWGGEFLLVDGVQCERLAHLEYVPLPGGQAAVRHPWRMALSYLRAAAVDADQWPHLLRTVPPERLALVNQMLDRAVQAPPTSSAGRLFDGVAALLGIRDECAYEAQAAIELETVSSTGDCGTYPVDLVPEGNGWAIGVAPLIRAIVADRAGGRPVASIGAAFHQALADAIVRVVGQIAPQGGSLPVALTGGVFQNAQLVTRSVRALQAAGYRVLCHRQVPCNDGGLALGQVAVAARRAAAGLV